MEALTGGNLLIALIVVVALMEVFNLTTKTIDNIKAAKKPTVDLEKTVETHGRLLEDEKGRLDCMEEGQSAMCKAMLAILSHEINGNSIDKLREAQTDLTNYLVKR